MKSTHHVGSAALALFTALPGCLQSPGQQTSTPLAAPFSGGDASLLRCGTTASGAQYANCALKGQALVIVPEFRFPATADVSLTVRSGCSTANTESSLRLIDAGGGSAAHAVPLRYMSDATVTLTTASFPIILEDTNPAGTAARRFHRNAPCDLSISWEAVPSGKQVTDWSLIADRTIGLIDAKMDLYEYRKMVRTWFEAFISCTVNGGTCAVKTVLEREIENLEMQGPVGRLKAASLRKIIQNAPLETIMRDYSDYRAELEALRAEARTFEALLAYWQQAVISASVNARSTAAGRALEAPF